MTPRRAAALPPLACGWREWGGLPELGIDRIKIKLDTGARTSALHAWNIQPFIQDGVAWVRFAVHPIQHDDARIVECAAPLVARRSIRNTSGKAEPRPIIRTRLLLGGRSWPIELSLVRRDAMGFRMLLGRAAMRRRLLIDPARSFLVADAETDR